MRRKIIYYIVFSIVFVNFIFIFPNLNADSGHEEKTNEVKKVNGEEVYEPKGDENALKKMTLPEEKKGEKKGEKKEKESEKKEPQGPMVNPQMKMEKPMENSSGSSEKMKKEMNEKDMQMSNKLTSYEEKPFDIYRPKGYIWFAAVFVILLFVIFVFT